MIGGRVDAAARLERLVGRPLAAAEFSHEVAAALGGALSFDGWCLIGFDPTSGLRSVQLGGRGTEHTVEMARNEALMCDVNSYRELAEAPVPVGWLSRTHPRAPLSFRLHEVLLPQGFESEIRLALRSRGRLWGALVLLREDPRRPFDEHDVAALTRLAGPLTRALRAYPVRRLPRPGSAPGAGVVAVAPDDRLLAVSAAAQEWLDDLVPGGDDQTRPSDVTRVVFDAAHAVRQGQPRRSSGCARTVTGRWLRVEGEALTVGAADVAVVLRPATVAELLGPLAAYHGLTAREAEVLGLLALGLPAKHIARDLEISTLTVNGHLRSVYGKCGVTGRDELLGTLT